MYEVEAKKLVEETFSGKYDNDKFRIFINELVGNSSNKLEWRDKTYAGNSLPESHAKLIESYKYLCRFIDGADEIGVFVVKLRSFTTLERARSFQRSFIARQMQQFGKDAALVAFYTDEKPEWRFSYVRLQQRFSTSSSEKYLTPVRRSSFLVGDTVRQHTAKRQLITLLLSSESMSLAVLEEAFSIEPVTNEFFNEYKNIYENLLSHLQERIKAGLQFENEQEKPIEIKLKDFAKHLLGQLVFLYFLQKKRWLGAARGDYFDEGKTDFLHNLYKKGGFNNFYDDKLTYLLHHALATDSSKKKESDYYKEFGGKIPYLNGGLFEAFCGYDWKQPLNISNDIFKEIFETFDTYNFTIHEDEPLENEVAIDPEMLGKVFENLIPENERKGSGTYYTPRKIVYYMCQEAIIDYLHGYFKKSISRDDIEEFVIYCDTMQEHNAIVQDKREKGQDSKTYKEFKIPDSIKQSAPDIDKALQDVRICDPAIGSGAFPVGIMLEITRLRMALDKAILSKDLTAYQCKRHCVEKCLYGSDMEPSAVEIARLRFWLSLTIDDERDDIQRDRIIPLPNLDYKIIQGDALKRTKIDLFNFDTIQNLEELKETYFFTGDKELKIKLKKQIDAEIKKLLESENGEDNYDIRLLFSEIFHGDDRGFDIILANPPYIQLQKEQKEGGKLADRYERYKYETFVRSGDIYGLFYERAIELLKHGGVFAFITSNKWMRVNYGKELRSFFTNKTTPLALLDLGANAFDTATVDTNILITRKGEPPNKTFRAAILHDHKEQDLYQYMQDEENVIDMPLPNSDGQWLILSQAERNLLEKIESKGKALKDWGISISIGIITGANEAFVIDRGTKDRLIAEDPKSEELIKPVLRGKDLKKWYPIWQDKWLINSHDGYSNISRIDIVKDYPAIYEWLLKCEEESEKAKRIGKTTRTISNRTNQGSHWTNLRSCNYQDEFEKEKIIYSEIVQSPQFYYDTKKYYTEASTFIMTGKYIKYIVAILNSSISHAIFTKFYAGGGLGNTGKRYKKRYLIELPIPQIPESEQKLLTDLVDKIIAITDSTDRLDDKQQQEIDAIQKQIDELVRRLYELTDAEIEILQKPTQSITT